jgi:hypothetical protein
MISIGRYLFSSIFCCLFSISSKATDIEPRAFSNAPIGTQFFVASIGHATGGVAFDDALAAEDVNAAISSLAVGYGQVFNFFGQSAKAALILPAISGNLDGLLEGEPTVLKRRGKADAILMFSTNLYGAPALSPKEFQLYKQQTVVGFSMQVRVPTGEYDQDRLINLGANRYSIRPRLGISHHVESWTYEIAIASTVYTDNDDFVGSKLERDAVHDIQIHAIRHFRPGMWMAFNAIKVHGGRTRIDGVGKDDLQKTDRLGLTFSLPLAPHHSLKAVAQTGVNTRIGEDLNSLTIAYQYAW